MAPWVVNLDGVVPDPVALGPCVNPVARDSGFIKYTESDSSSIASFSFKTSQARIPITAVSVSAFGLGSHL